MENKARRYSSIKYGLTIVETIMLLAFLLILHFSQASAALVRLTSALLHGHNGYINSLLYTIIVFVFYYLVSFPVNFYHSFLLEHEFGLSKQNISGWFADQLKSMSVVFVIFAVCIGVFYAALIHYPSTWWLVISFLWLLFNILMARLAPLVIVPLFYKYKPLTDPALRDRLMHLAQKMHIRVLDVFSLDFSKKTVKANAGLMGFGPTKRVVLSDTLISNYSPDEIEVVLAHEFAHYKLRHMFKLIIINTAATVLLSYAMFVLSAVLLPIIGIGSLASVEALPFIVLFMVLFGIICAPVTNGISRVFELHADLVAVEITHKKDVFVSVMNKLAGQNLSDRRPHTLIKHFFFDHPAIDERIAMVEERFEGYGRTK